MPVEPISRDAAHAAALLAKSVDVALQDVELSPSQFRLLAFLSEAPSAATALADKLAVTRPSLTALVDGLAARGFVIRTTDPEDRRRVTHEIAPAGAEAVAAAVLAIQQRLGGRIAAHLSADEVATVNRGLELWIQAVRAGSLQARSGS